MTTPKDNEPTEHDDNDAAKKKLYDILPDFWKGYVGVVDSSKDPNAGTYKTSASAIGQEYSDLLWEEYQRDQAEAKLRYERERKQQQ
ncbi:MAG: hypothetical protein J4G13_04200 [Dehalococcoidia bacterium]|nr:hypothetical protein [Dehalococcoidia bacterium]